MDDKMSLMCSEMKNDHHGTWTKFLSPAYYMISEGEMKIELKIEDCGGGYENLDGEMIEKEGLTRKKSVKKKVSFQDGFQDGRKLSSVHHYLYSCDRCDYETTRKQDLEN